MNDIKSKILSKLAQAGTNLRNFAAPRAKAQMGVNPSAPYQDESMMHYAGDTTPTANDQYGWDKYSASQIPFDPTSIGGGDFKTAGGYSYPVSYLRGGGQQFAVPQVRRGATNAQANDVMTDWGNHPEAKNYKLMRTPQQYGGRVQGPEIYY
jgi:hypothetical protein